MGNLIRMDLYRMNKARSFRVCLILSFAFAMLSTPIEKLFYDLGKLLSPGGLETFPATVDLSSLISGSIGPLVAMLTLLSIVCFYFADMENGYIKNIAGQMPRRGYSVLSRFIAALPHNLVFMLVSLVGSILGTVFFKRIIMDSKVLESLGTFLLKLLLLQSICAILLLVTASFRNKSFGMILAVLMGLSLMDLIYLGISSGLQQLLGPKFDILPYMPDSVLREPSPPLIRSLLVSAVTICIFLPLSIRVFDKRDIK